MVFNASVSVMSHSLGGCFAVVHMARRDSETSAKKSSPDQKLMTLAVGAGCRARGCFEYPVKVGEVFESAIKTDFEDFFGARA